VKLASVQADFSTQAAQAVTQETQETSDHVFTHEKNHSRGKRDFTSPVSPVSPDTNKSAEEQPHITDDTEPDASGAAAPPTADLPEGWRLVKCDHRGDVTRFGVYWRAAHISGKMTEPSQYADNAARAAWLAHERSDNGR
jgi:hypothetical protein